MRHRPQSSTQLAVNRTQHASELLISRIRFDSVREDDHVVRTWNRPTVRIQASEI